MSFVPRWTLGPAMGFAALLLGGCAGVPTLGSDVSSYGQWPAGRAPGSYAFDRLPSQQANAAQSDALEATARGALEKAGFKAAAPGSEPEVLVQVGAADAQVVFAPWDDPLWWRGGFGPWRYGPWAAPRWGLGYRYEPFPRYERQVALLLRDRASGKPLFETRASSEGLSRTTPAVLGAMFEAALANFPVTDAQPRRVVVPLAR